MLKILRIAGTDVQCGFVTAIPPWVHIECGTGLSARTGRLDWLLANEFAVNEHLQGRIQLLWAQRVLRLRLY
jgi:hypothetical protein